MAVYLFAAFMVLLVGASVGQHNHKKGIVLFIFLISFLFLRCDIEPWGQIRPYTGQCIQSLRHIRGNGC